MRFRARAVDATHQPHSLLLDAIDAEEARRQLQARGLVVLQLRAQRSLGGSRAQRFSLLLFAQELLALVGAGLGVVEALDALVEKESQPARRQVLERIALALRGGQRLSAALAAQPGVFGPLFVGLVASAEGTSDLPRALARYIAYASRHAALRERLVSAAVYPAVLLVVGLAVSAFLLGYVVPRFALVIAGAGRELPWGSRVLMQWGQFAADHAASLAFAAAVVGSGLLLAARHHVRRSGWTGLLRRLPGAARHVDALVLARLYLTLGMLLDGGIALVRALQLCEGVLPQGHQPRLRAVRDAVRAGQALSEALEAQGLCTPVALRLVRAGERSGQLGDMLARAASFHDEESGRWIERFSRAFEPMLMAAIGLVIGLIVILLYMPVFELAGSLQ